MVDDAWGIVLTVDQRGSRSAPDRVTGLISALEDLPARSEAVPAGRLLTAAETRALSGEWVSKMASQNTREAIGIGAAFRTGSRRADLSRAEAR